VTSVINIGVVVSFLFAMISLIIMIGRTRRFGNNPLYAREQGDIKKGIVYAFVKGMTPWEKESARNHLPTYIFGVVYHIGIFITLIFLFSIVLRISLPFFIIYILRYSSLIGFVCGMSLFFKRIFSSLLRGISDPDDYISNLLVDNFLLFGFLSTYSVGFIIPFGIISIILFLYIPLGKIRHCAFFFVERILFGMFYGRRGVYPTNR